MAFPFLALAMAGGTALKGGIGAFQKDQQRQALLSAQRAEVRQRNRLGRIQDQQLFDEYQRSVKAETEAYELKKEAAARQISLNNSAYQRTIETGLTSLADLSDNFIAKAQSRKIKLARSTGVAAASGATGVTAERADTMQRAAAGRQEGMEGASKERAVGQYIFNTNLAKEQVEQANWRAYSSVAIPPTFGPPPVSSGMIQRPKDQTGSALMADIAGVAIDSAMSFVGNLPKAATIPGGGTNRSSLSFDSGGFGSFDPVDSFGTDASLPFPGAQPSSDLLGAFAGGEGGHGFYQFGGEIGGAYSPFDVFSQ